jgi:membrane-associated phospholipid phosphatase
LHAPFDVRDNTPADWILGGLLLVTAPALAFPHRPATWPLVLAVHLLLAMLLLARPVRERLLRPVAARAPQAFEIIRLWYPLLLIPALYSGLPLLNRSVHGGVYFDRIVLAWEDALFGGQPSQTWARAAPHLWLSEPLHAAYLSYFLVIAVPPLLLYLSRRIRAFQEVVVTFALVIAIHQIVFVYFPVAGPRYLFPAPTGGGIEHGCFYRWTHRVLEAGSSQGAAFPSGHVAVSIAQTIACARHLPRLAPVLAVFAVGIGVSTVYGGFHYLVDALAGALVGSVGACAALYGMARTPGGAMRWVWGEEDLRGGGSQGLDSARVAPSHDC